MSDQEGSQQDAKNGIGCWALVVVLALVAGYFWYSNRPETLEYSPGSSVQLNLHDGQPKDFQYLNATLVTDISDMHSPSRDNPLLSVAHLQPDGATLPDGVEVTWPLTEERPAGNKLWIVGFDTNQEQWLATGDFAQVNQQGNSAIGRVYHFSFVGLVDRSPTEMEPESVRRPTELNVPPQKMTLKDHIAQTTYEKTNNQDSSPRTTDSRNIDHGNARDPRSVMNRMQVPTVSLSPMPKFPEAKEGPTGEDQPVAGFITLNDKNWKKEVTDYDGMIVVVFMAPDYGKVELLGIESARLTPSPDIDKHMTSMRAIEEQYRGTVKFGILRQEDGSMDSWVRFADYKSISATVTTAFFKKGREVGRIGKARSEEVIVSMIERYLK